MRLLHIALLGVAMSLPAFAMGAPAAASANGPGPKHKDIRGHGFTEPGFGLLYTLGFSSIHTEKTSSDLHTRLDLGWSGGNWETAFELRANGSWLNGKSTSEEYATKGRANYSLTDSTYVWGWAGYLYNRYSQFQYQANEIVGYGYTPINNNNRILRLEIGAGAGQDKTRRYGRTHSGVSEMAREVYAQHFGPSGDAFVEQALRFVHTSNNLYSEFSLRFIQPIGGGWSVWSGYRLEHNSAASYPGSVQTVSWISLNIGYQFGARRYGI